MTHCGDIVAVVSASNRGVVLRRAAEIAERTRSRLTVIARPDVNFMMLGGAAISSELYAEWHTHYSARFAFVDSLLEDVPAGLPVTTVLCDGRLSNRMRRVIGTSPVRLAVVGSRWQAACARRHGMEVLVAR
jgi:hypothetical protein